MKWMHTQVQKGTFVNSPSHSEDAIYDNGLHRVRMFLSIDQSQGRPPATTKHHPLCHNKVLTKLLQVRDKIPCCVILLKAIHVHAHREPAPSNVNSFRGGWLTRLVHVYTQLLNQHNMYSIVILLLSLH